MERFNWVLAICLASLVLGSGTRELGSQAQRSPTKSHEKLKSAKPSEEAALGRFNYCVEHYAGVKNLMAGGDMLTVSYEAECVPVSYNYRVKSVALLYGQQSVLLGELDSEIRRKKLELEDVDVNAPGGLEKSVRLDGDIYRLEGERSRTQSNVPWRSETVTASVGWNDIAKITFTRFDEIARPEEKLNSLGRILVTFKDRPLKSDVTRKVVGVKNPSETTTKEPIKEATYLFDSNGRLVETVKALRQVVDALGLKLKVVEVRRGE